MRRAIELHADGLSAHPGVIGIGAEWDTHSANKGEYLQHAVAVYVASYGGVSDADSAENPLPTTIEIPARGGVHVIPVVIKQIGELEAQASSGPKLQAAADTEVAKAENPDDEGEELFYAE